MDPISKATDFLLGLLDRMGINSTLDVIENDDHILINVNTPEPERLIGRHGRVLECIQHLLVKVVYTEKNTEKGKHTPIFVDAGGYRQKHVERLEGIAARTADKVKETGGTVPLAPMTPHDRRIVHMYLSQITGVSTQSEGEGDNRHIVVSPA